MADELLDRIKLVSARALASGALQSIPTRQEVVEDQGAEFLLRVLDNLARKDEARDKLKRAGSHRTDPFLPYEQALYVEEVEPRHRCLLNKFNVVKDHLLIVTREFEPQSDLLNLGDFQALAHCMAQMPALGFFNGGAIAGASQQHKHLQLVPLPMAPFESVPFGSLLKELNSDQPQRLKSLAFRHAVIGLTPQATDGSEGGAKIFDQAYQVLRALAGLRTNDPYNLLVTGEWMLLVPRTAEKWQHISFNALAFCGAILVKDPQQAESLKRAGLMRVLASLT